MIINGKERGFFYSVFSSGKLAELCPEKSITNIDALFSDDAIGGQNLPKVARILNEADELRKVWEAKARGETYVADVLEEEELYTLPMYEMQEIEMACFEAIRAGSVREVETKPVKKTKNAVNKSS